MQLTLKLTDNENTVTREMIIGEYNTDEVQHIVDDMIDTLKQLKKL